MMSACPLGVQVNLAYRWFCKLGIEDGYPTIRRSAVPSILDRAATGKFA
jgi:hypothetical protein